MRWRDGFDCELIAARLDACRKVVDGEFKGFSGWEYLDHESLVADAVNWQVTVPEVERWGIAADAIRSAAAKGTITHRSLMGELDMLTRAFTALQTQRFVVLTTILGIVPGSEVEFEIAGNTVVIRKARAQGRGQALIRGLRGRATVAMSTDEILALTRGDGR